MRVAIHQPHYFPWLGYLAKMASVDKFIFLDTVQLKKRSYMIRNRIIDLNGKIKYLNVTADTHDHFNREYRDIRTKDFENWSKRQKDLLIDAYRKSRWFDEIWDVILPIFNEKYEFLCEITIQSVMILRKIFEIDTLLVLQSDIGIDKSLKKNELILGLCKSVSADTYYSGNGARKYMVDSAFEKEGIHVIYQQFEHPVYEQMGNHPFEPGLSALDLLFNYGIKNAKEIFWNSVEEKKL